MRVFNWCRAILALSAFGLLSSCSSDEKGSTTPDENEVLPAPIGLAVAGYDTLNGVASLRWNAVKHPKLGGYLVYRGDPGEFNAVSITKTLIKDSVYADSIFKDTLSEGARHFEYRVQALGQDRDVNSPMSAAATVEAVSPLSITTRLSWSEPDLIGNKVALDETVRLVLAFSNPNLAHGSLRWFRGGQSGPVREMTGLGRESRDTLDLKFDAQGSEKVWVELTDSRGQVWNLEREYSVEGPPQIQGLRLVKYDTSKGEAHLVWNRTTRSGMDGYVVYRSKAGEEPKAVSGDLLKDTVFIDKVYPSPEGEPLDLEYRVKVKDDLGAYSPKYSGPIACRSIPPKQVLSVVELRNSNFTGKLVHIGDSIRISVVFSNPSKTHSALRWYVDGGQAPVRTTVSQLGRSGADTLGWVFRQPGVYAVRAEVVDEDGKRASAVAAIRACAITGFTLDSIELDWQEGFRIIGHPTWFEQPYLSYQKGIEILLARDGWESSVGIYSPENDTTIIGEMRLGALFPKAGMLDVILNISGNRLKSPIPLKVLERKAPQIISVVPNTGRRGETIPVTITGHRIGFYSASKTLVEISLLSRSDGALVSMGNRLSGVGTLDRRPMADGIRDTAILHLPIPADATPGYYDVRVRSNVALRPSYIPFTNTWPELPMGFQIVE